VSLDDTAVVHALLRERVPSVRWDARLVAQCVSDFADLDNRPEVAARCAEYMQQTPGARNGPRTLRRFFEQERETARVSRETEREADRLAVYHRPRNANGS
jgi:hypothetical protein